MLLITLYAALLANPAQPATWHVRASAPPTGDGTSWTTAFSDLQSALARASSGDAIWVAAGIYRPTTGADRDASFHLKEGVSLYGGFQGNETQLSQRDWNRNPTILSGDIGREGVPEDNSFHVVHGANQAILDGFLIRDGYAVPTRGGPPGGPGPRPGPGPNPGQRRPPPGPGGPRQGQPVHISPQQILAGVNPGSGAGMVNFQSAPTVRNCIFENNRAAKGGAVYNMTSTDFPPRPGNRAPAPTFIDCIFRNNWAAGRGGAISNDLGTSPVFLNCRFENNETPQKGAGIYNDFAASPVLINCLFLGNRADSAAALGNDGGSSPVLLHCTFTANHARNHGPSLYQGTGPSNNPVLLQSIVWGNRCDWEDPGIYDWHDNRPHVESSIVEGGYPGASSTDPHLNASHVASTGEGYKPGDPRFTEATLPALLQTLAKWRATGPAERRPPGPPPLAAAPEPSNRVIYVNARRTPGGDGTSWNTAFSSLTAALENAARDAAEIWVAAGTYTPSPSDRSASFTLSPNVRLYGGFTGVETALTQRDHRKNVTILSGEIGAPGKREDNSHHVLTGANGAIVDGFTITAGYADGPGYDGKGGGLINYRRAPQDRPNLPRITGYSTEVRNCLFTANYARDGGAVYSYDRAKPKFVRTVFHNNSAINGGAVLDRVGVETTFEECEFTSNSARWRGGALYFDYGSRPKIQNSVFRQNATQGHGGAIYSLSRASQLENTVVTVSTSRFERNTAEGDGGAANFDDSTVATVEGCTFTANQAKGSGGDIATTNRSTTTSNPAPR